MLNFFQKFVPKLNFFYLTYKGILAIYESRTRNKGFIELFLDLGKTFNVLKQKRCK